MEIWKPIIGYEGIYEVSCLGEVRSVRKGRCKLLSTWINRIGNYKSLHVQLYKDRTERNCTVSRLVAQAFIENPENKPFVNHKDGDSLNNKPDNLEWCTQKENIYHSKRVSKNGAVISSQKIKKLYGDNPNASLREFVDILLENCK